MTLEPRRPRPPAYPRRATAADPGRRLLPLLRGLVTPSVCVLLLLLLAPPTGSPGGLPAETGQATPGTLFAETPCKGKVAAPPSSANDTTANASAHEEGPPPCQGIVAPPPCSGDVVAPPIKDPPPCKGEIAIPVPPVSPLPPSVKFRDVTLVAFCADPRSWLALQVRMRGSVRRMSDPDYPGGGYVLEDGTTIGSVVARAPLVGGVRESDLGPAVIEGRVVQLEGRNPLTRQTGTWYAIAVDRIVLERR